VAQEYAVRGISPPVRPIINVVTALILIAPTLIVLVSSLGGGHQIVFPPRDLTLHWYAQLVSDVPTWHALLNSLHVALVAVAVGVLAGAPAALALPRFSPRWRVAVIVALSLGLSVPIIVAAFSFFGFFAELGILEHLTAVGVAIGIVNLPFMLWPVISAMEDQDPELPAAAATLGADPVEQFLFIRLPLIAPGIVTGAIIVFVLSITDFVISQVLTTVNNQTLPVFIYSGLRTTISPGLGAASALFILIASAVFILVLRVGGGERFLLRRGAAS
jgi:putative spermidine/putrescine transport system permease protein